MRPGPGKALVYTLLLLSAACVDPYDTDLHNDELNILVVDGFMNTDLNEVNVRLSRTLPMDADSIGTGIELHGNNRRQHR